MPGKPKNAPEPPIEWFIKSTHDTVSGIATRVHHEIVPTVVLYGLKGRKRSFATEFTAVPRVGEGLRFGSGETGSGEYVVVRVVWSVHQYPGNIVYPEVYLEPVKKGTLPSGG